MDWGIKKYRIAIIAFILLFKCNKINKEISCDVLNFHFRNEISQANILQAISEAFVLKSHRITSNILRVRTLSCLLRELIYITTR